MTAGLDVAAGRALYAAGPQHRRRCACGPFSGALVQASLAVPSQAGIARTLCDNGRRRSQGTGRPV